MNVSLEIIFFLIIPFSFISLIFLCKDDIEDYNRGNFIFFMLFSTILIMIALVSFSWPFHKKDEENAIFYNRLDKRNETIISIIGDHKYRVTDSTLNEWNFYITDSITGDVYYLIYDEASDSYRYEEVEISDKKKQENREYE